METNQNERVRIFRNDVLIEKHRRKIEESLPFIQPFLDEAKRLEIEVNTDDLWQAVLTPKEFAENDFAHDLEEPGTITVGRLTKSGKKSLVGFDIPDIENFIRLAGIAKDKISLIGYTTMQIDNYIVSVNEDEFNVFTENNSVYISTPDEKEVWESAIAMCNAIEKYNETIIRKCDRKAGFDPTIQMYDFIIHERIEGKQRLFPNLHTFFQMTKKFRLLH